MKRLFTFLPLLLFFCQPILRAEEPPPPLITNLNVNASQRNLRFKPYPAASKYTILSATNLAAPFTADTNFFQAPYVINLSSNKLGGYSTNFGYEWRATNRAARSAFYRVQVTPMSSNS